MYIDKSELLRYLGYRGQQYDIDMGAKIDKAIEICLDRITPRSIVKKYELSHSPLSVIGAQLPLEGRDIAEHLKDCGGVYVIGATLGFEIEKTVGRLIKEDASLAVLVDSAGTCAIESYCDDICEELQSREEMKLTSRFSCGYGDFPLSLQPYFSSVLEMQKRIGVYVDSASFMMSPQKSVTAVVGISNSAAKQGADKSKRCDLKCANCGNINCQFRKV